MNNKKLYFHQSTLKDLNLNTIEDQTKPFILNNSQIMKLTTSFNQQNQKISKLIKTIDDSRQEQNKRFNQHFQELLNCNSKQYNQEILKEISYLKHQFQQIEENQATQINKQKSDNYSHLPPLQSSYFEQQNQEKKDLSIYTQDQKNNKGIKSSSIYEKEIQDFNQQLQATKKSHSTHKKSKQNHSKNNYTKTEVSPPQSSKRLISESQTIMSKQNKRKQKFNNSNYNNFHQFMDPLRIQTEQDKFTIKSQQKKQFDKKKTRQLLRRFKVVSICVQLSITLLKYCQKIWYQKYMIFKDWSQELISQYDSQFNYQQVVDKFYKECLLKKLINKSWVFKSHFDIQIKCHNILIALEIFLKNLIVQSLDLSLESINFIQKFSMKKGYLLSGHSRFVINRINIRPNHTLKQLMNILLKTQMIILEYSYIQILLPLIVQGEFWMRMPNYKESLKIFIQILHYLYIETFQNLPQIQQLDIINDNDWIVLFDFSRNPIDGFYQLINYKHPKYSYNKDCVVLGLYNKVELHPIILHNGFNNIRDSFRQYCDYIITQIL